jgi:hypothetical protein
MQSTVHNFKCVAQSFNIVAGVSVQPRVIISVVFLATIMTSTKNSRRPFIV